MESIVDLLCAPYIGLVLMRSEIEKLYVFSVFVVIKKYYVEAK